MTFSGTAASGQPGPQPRSELRLRILSGLVLAAVALVATWLGGTLFALLWLAAALAIAYEWNAMTRTAPRRSLTVASWLGLAGLAIALPAGAGLPVVLAILGSVVVALVLLARDARSRLWSLAGFGYAALVALVPPAARADPALGPAIILWMFACVWTTDVTAYFVGRRFGGPKLWPSVSPKKTWSGFAGGLLGAMAACMLVAALASEASRTTLGAIAVASAVASVASQFGDLAESALKRRFGVKDSGQLIPGHGGVMDRLDGFVAVALLVGLALAGARLAR